MFEKFDLGDKLGERKEEKKDILEIGGGVMYICMCFMMHAGIVGWRHRIISNLRGIYKRPMTF